MAIAAPQLNVIKEVVEIENRNEYESARLLFSRPDNIHKLFAKLRHSVKRRFEHLALLEAANPSATVSNNALQSGDYLYAKEKTNENLMMAYRHYNAAILEARGPHADKRHAALAYASRAKVLCDMQLYKESQDNCCAAIECGYPEESLAKVLGTQALCAIHLNNMDLAETYISQMTNLPLDPDSERDLRKLNKLLEKKRRGPTRGMRALRYAIEAIEAISAIGARGARGARPLESEEIQESDADNITRIKYIVEPSEQSISGSKMLATENISKNAKIFTERVFKVKTEKQITSCEYCGGSILITYPCINCGNTTYCSLECRNKDSPVHRYVCLMYHMKDLFEPDIPLVARLTTKYLSQALPLLRDLSTADEIWDHLSVIGDASGETRSLLRNTEYYNILVLKSKYLQSDSPKKLTCAQAAAKFVVYLREYTDFFEQFNNIAVPVEDWWIITGALITRHLSILPLLLPNCQAELINPFFGKNYQIFENPKNVAKGRLNQLVSSSIPYFSTAASKCNHSCAPNMFLSLNGNKATAYALRDIRAGEEITVSYGCEYTYLPFPVRYMYFRNFYDKYKCLCEICRVQKESKENDHFMVDHFTYRCTRKNCLQYFKVKVMYFPDPSPEKEQMAYGKHVVWSNYWTKIFFRHQNCKCRIIQNHMHTFRNISESTQEDAQVSPSNRSIKELLSLYKKTKGDYAEHALVCMFMRTMIVKHCLQTHVKGRVRLSSNQFKLINKMFKSLIETMRKVCAHRPTTWIVTNVIAFDLITIGKAKYPKSEISTLLENFNFLPNAFKEIYVNYYNKFIKEK